MGKVSGSRKEHPGDHFRDELHFDRKEAEDLFQSLSKTLPKPAYERKPVYCLVPNPRGPVCLEWEIYHKLEASVDPSHFQIREIDRNWWKDEPPPLLPGTRAVVDKTFVSLKEQRESKNWNNFFNIPEAAESRVLTKARQAGFSQAIRGLDPKVALRLYNFLSGPPEIHSNIAAMIQTGEVKFPIDGHNGYRKHSDAESRHEHH